MDTSRKCALAGPSPAPRTSAVVVGKTAGAAEFGPPSVSLLTMLAARDGEQGRWFFELLSSVSVLFWVSSVVALSVT